MERDARTFVLTRTRTGALLLLIELLLVVAAAGVLVVGIRAGVREIALLVLAATIAGVVPVSGFLSTRRAMQRILRAGYSVGGTIAVTSEPGGVRIEESGAPPVHLDVRSARAYRTITWLEITTREGRRSVVVPTAAVGAGTRTVDTGSADRPRS